MSKIKYILFFVLITISAAIHFYQLQQAISFPKTLFSKNLTITAKIIQISSHDAVHSSFIIKTQKICIAKDCQNIKKNIRLSLYYSDVNISPGQIWRFNVRLKPWHGYANPGVYNSELWAFVHGIAATGYVINQSSPMLLKKVMPYSLTALHEHISRKIETLSPDNANTQAVLKALILGDKSTMSYPLRQLLQATGTSHLLAISGLHIGLMAMFAYYIFLFFWRLSARLCLIIPAPRAALIFSLFTALIYALLTGFATPAMRASLMVAFFVGASIFNQKFALWQVFLYSLIICLICQPFAVLTISFWLSYFAVFMILYLICFRLENKKFISYWKIQLGITLGMVPILFFYFQKTSVIGIVANAYAIPLVSFLILPIAFLASVFPMDLISHWLFVIAHYLIQLLIYLLTYTADLPGSVFYFAISNIWILLLSILGCLLLFAPRQLRLAVPGFFLLLPLFYYKPIKLTAPDYQMTVLDVGQGLSVVVNTAHHTLVYDLGPIFPNGNSATQAVVIPYLRSQRISHVDKLVISHQDSDHVGDLANFLKSIKTDNVQTSALIKLKKFNVQACQAGQSWQWDGIKFEMLSPLTKPDIGNNAQSCVLKIDNGYHAVLLTGDIDKNTEHILIKQEGGILNSDVLVVPHHGSNSSSSLAFIKAVQPSYAIVSEGFLNRYHFPSSKVTQRFANNDVNLQQTSQCGAIIFDFLGNKKTKMSCFRYNHHKFWYY